MKRKIINQTQHSNIYLVNKKKIKKNCMGSHDLCGPTLMFDWEKIKDNNIRLEFGFKKWVPNIKNK